MKYNGYVWDMESDNFYHQSTTIWYIYSYYRDWETKPQIGRAHV